MANSKVHVAGAEVGRQIQKEDLEDKFRTFGTISSVWVARQPPGFAFIEFEDPRDAEDAIREMNNKEILGCPIKVEESRNGRRGGGGGGDGFNDVKPGDWPCDSCGANNFARRLECFRCGAPKPGGGGGGGGGGYRDDRNDRYDDRRDGGRGYRDDYRGGGGGGGYRDDYRGGGGYRDDGASIMHAVLFVFVLFLFDALVILLCGGSTFDLISSTLLTFLPLP
jgi:hypothetical protein